MHDRMWTEPGARKIDIPERVKYHIKMQEGVGGCNSNKVRFIILSFLMKLG